MTCMKLFLCIFIIIIIKSCDGKPAMPSSSAEYMSTPLTNKNYKEILRSNKYVFVKFFAEWCTFSKKILKIWENVGENFESSQDILIAEIDCGKFKPVCQKFNVREYPTLLIFKDGKRFERYIGPRTTKDIVDYTKKFLARRKMKDLIEAKAKQQQQQQAAKQQQQQQAPQPQKVEQLPQPQVQQQQQQEEAQQVPQPHQAQKQELEQQEQLLQPQQQ